MEEMKTGAELRKFANLSKGERELIDFKTQIWNNCIERAKGGEKTHNVTIRCHSKKVGEERAKEIADWIVNEKGCTSAKIEQDITVRSSSFYYCIFLF